MRTNYMPAMLFSKRDTTSIKGHQRKQMTL